MSTAAKYRTGAKGALLDEYQRALKELQEVVSGLSGEDLATILDDRTSDEDCRSIGNILTHVVHSGYGYSTSIHNRGGDRKQRPDKIFHTNLMEYLHDLSNMFSFTEQVFEHVSENELEQLDESRKIKTSWNQFYDIEQLMEHAIVHILRHRRQIEKFKIVLADLKK